MTTYTTEQLAHSDEDTINCADCSIAIDPGEPLYATESGEQDPSGLRSTDEPAFASGGDTDRPRRATKRGTRGGRRHREANPAPAVPSEALARLRREYEARRS